MQWREDPSTWLWARRCSGVLCCVVASQLQLYHVLCFHPNTFKKAAPTKSTGPLHHNYISGNFRHGSIMWAPSKVLFHYYIGQKITIEWSCGHRGFFHIDWLKKAMPKRTNKKQLITVSNVTVEQQLTSHFNATSYYCITIGEWEFCWLSKLFLKWNLLFF